MFNEDMSVSEQFFRGMATCQTLFMDRERELDAAQSVIEARLKEKENECEKLADELNGKNCEVHECKKEINKWKELAASKSVEVDELKRRIVELEAKLQEPSTTHIEARVAGFTGIPDDLSTVRFTFDSSPNFLGVAVYAFSSEA